MDANRYAALKESMNNIAKFDTLEQYRTSPLFADAERAVLKVNICKRTRPGIDPLRVGEEFV
jgi:hypothetical protein